MEAVYRLKGKITATNSNEFADDLMAFYEANGETVLDASELEYISSSGIRGLMKLYKAQKNVRIDNVSEDVFQIFYFAGLTEVFKINTAIPELINDGWDIAGVGASGTVYRIDSDTAIKVYSEGIGFDYVNQERELARQAFISGVPTIIPNRNAKVGNCFATIFELINSRSLGEMLASEPDKYDELMDEYVSMMKNMHSIEDTKGYFKNLQDLWLKYEYMIKEGLRKEDAEFVIDTYRNSKRSNNLLHGDIHPGNVMISDGEMVLVDMASMSTGPELLDVITVYRLSMYAEHVGLLEAAEKSMGIPHDMFAPFWDSFARRYFETDDKDTLNLIKDQMFMITALDMMFSINTIPPENARNYYKIVGDKIMDTIINPHKDLIRKIFAEGKLDI